MKPFHDYHETGAIQSAAHFDQTGSRRCHFRAQRLPSDLSRFASRNWKIRPSRAKIQGVSRLPRLSAKQLRDRQEELT